MSVQENIMTPQQVAARLGPTLTDELLEPIVDDLTKAGYDVTVTREEGDDGLLRIWIWHADWWNATMMDNLVELSYERRDGSWHCLS